MLKVHLVFGGFLFRVTQIHYSGVGEHFFLVMCVDIDVFYEGNFFRSPKSVEHGYMRGRVGGCRGAILSILGEKSKNSLFSRLFE